jgi:lipid A 3-O-deacylase
VGCLERFSGTRTAIGVVAVILLGVAQPPSLVAQGSAWLPRIRLDNDAYNFWLQPGHRTDDEYTNGVVISFETLRAPWWGRRLSRGTPDCARSTVVRGACLSTTVAIGQDIYTPRLDHAPYSSPGWELERPYAAWLYLSASSQAASPRQLRVLTVATGVTGPPALGATAQKVAHSITSKYTAEARGWDTQVGFQAGVLATYRQSLLALRAAPGGHGIFDLAPTASVSLGNIRTAADAGLRARLGFNLSHPWDPRAWRGRPLWELQATGTARREYVAYDFSLDGTVLHPSRRVDRVPEVSEYEVGLGLRVWRFSVGYRAVTRGREYVSGPRTHRYSSMLGALEFFP